MLLRIPREPELTWRKSCWLNGTWRLSHARQDGLQTFRCPASAATPIPAATGSIGSLIGIVGILKWR